jgi:hypothetical protein
LEKSLEWVSIVAKMLKSDWLKKYQFFLSDFSFESKLTTLNVTSSPGMQLPHNGFGNGTFWPLSTQFCMQSVWHHKFFVV